MIAFWVNERVGAGFQADGTFEFFLKKFLEGCMDGGQCEDHDEKKMMMLVIGDMCGVVVWLIVWVDSLSFGCCVALMVTYVKKAP